MNRSYIVHGPTGCGKTRNAERIAAALGLTKVQDNWSPMDQVFEPFDTLYLAASEGPWPDQARHVLSFAEAMGRVPDAVVEPKCTTCNDNGVIGGPSFYAPGEGGVPCPDCAQPSPVPAGEKPGDSILCSGCFAKGLGPEHFDEAGKCLVRQQTEPLGAEFAQVLSDNLPELLSTAQGEQTEAEWPDVVGYLDIGAGDYIDIGSKLTNEQLSQLPMGRHALVIVGTYGVDGYVANNELMTMAQHLRTVGELRFERDSFREAYLNQTVRLLAAEKERDLLGQALGECIEAAGILNPGVALTGPQLLLFAEDLKAHIGGLRGQLADTVVPMQPLVKDEDYMQFAQLIGYSVSGYSDLSYVSDDSRGLAYAKLDLLASTPDVADAQVEQVERPEVVGTAVLMLEAAGWRNDDPKASVTSVSELLSCIVGTLRAANAKLKKELAMARDAASKGDAARHAAGGMEMEIQELRENVAELKKELRSRWTYASTQATNCAGCGEHKHTPLRVDWMGGYVCLTCIDEKLEELHGDQVQHNVLEGWKLVPEDATLEMVEALKAELVTTSKGGILRAGIALNAAIAASPASSEES
ncbi:hypothetical protein [Pseudomonas aeruginosa]